MSYEDELLEALMKDLNRELDEEILRKLSGGCNVSSKSGLPSYTGQLDLFTPDGSELAVHITHRKAVGGPLHFTRWSDLPL